MARKISSLILKSLTGKLSAEEQSELDQWMADDSENRKLYERLRDMDNLEHEYKHWKAIGYERPLQDMKSRLSREGRPRRLRIVRYAAAAIFIGACLCLGTYTYYSRYGGQDRQKTVAQADSHDLPAGTTQAVLTLSNGKRIALSHNGTLPTSQGAEATSDRINSLATPRGGEFVVTLEDSTRVWLNAQSRLIYPETFAKNERRVKIEGEAYFKVAKDASRPFYVEAGGTIVRVTGTEFNVNAYADEADIATTLVTGGIALSPKGAGGSELILTPGRQAIVKRSDASTQVRSINTKTVTSWRNGRFVFEEQTLDQIMRTLARWYDFDYEISSPQLASTVFMGSAPRYANLSSVLSMLEKSGELKFNVSGRKVIVNSNSHK